MVRFDLTDFEWSVTESLLPTKVWGVRRVDDRRVLSGIFWRLRTGTPWAAIPARYGPQHDLRQPFQPMAQGWSLGAHSADRIRRLRR